MENLLVMLNNRVMQADERIREFEDGSIEIMQSEKQKKKKDEEKCRGSKTCGRASSIPTYT